jgi:ATP-dependent Clp protease ATP-binding subunit ClpA
VTSDIVALELIEIEKRLSDRLIKLELSESAKTYLVEEGYSKTYGARPLKRLMTKSIADQVAMYLLNNPETRDCTLLCFEEGGAIYVKKTMIEEKNGEK